MPPNMQFGYNRRRSRSIQEVTMSKTRLVIAAAALALMSVGASAQVSFESRGYGGPLGIGPNFQQGGQHAPPVYGSGQEHSNSTERYRAPQHIDRVQRKRNTDDDDVRSAKKTPAKEDSKEAKAQNENSSIVSIATDKDSAPPAPAVSEPSKTDLAKSEKGNSRNNENSAIASIASSTKGDTVRSQVTKADTDGSGKPTGCKRYFPTVGQTITVPCE
jgi:hypothetical protein